MMFTLEEVKKAVGGRLVSRTEEIVFATVLEITRVSTGTRTIKEGELFVALKGENFDGNAYAAQALEAGASYAIVQVDAPGDDPRLLRFPDTLQTLKELAAFVSGKLSPLETVTGTATSFVLKRYKEEGVIFDTGDTDRRLVISP